MTRPGDYGYPNYPPRFRQLASLHESLRADCAEMETLLEAATNDGTLSDKELKRLDKAVTVMKVGFKIMKKAIKQKRPSVECAPIVVGEAVRYG